MGRTKGSKNKPKVTTREIITPESQQPPEPRQQDALENDPTPGVGRQIIPQIEELALELERLERIAKETKKAAKDAMEAVLVAMEEHGVSTYLFGERRVELKVGNTRVKVRHVENPIERAPEEGD